MNLYLFIAFIPFIPTPCFKRMRLHSVCSKGAVLSVHPEGEIVQTKTSPARCQRIRASVYRGTHSALGRTVASANGNHATTPTTRFGPLGPHRVESFQSLCERLRHRFGFVLAVGTRSIVCSTRVLRENRMRKLHRNANVLFVCVCRRKSHRASIEQYSSVAGRFRLCLPPIRRCLDLCACT